MKNIFLSIVVFSGFLFSQEVMPVEIPLNGEAAERSLEMSGLAWYGDYLILMPQYVNKEAPGFYVLSKTKIQRLQRFYTVSYTHLRAHETLR